MPTDRQALLRHQLLQTFLTECLEFRVVMILLVSALTQEHRSLIGLPLRSSAKCKSSKRAYAKMDLLPNVISELKAGRLPSAELLILVATRVSTPFSPIPSAIFTVQLVGYAMTFAAFFVKLPQVLLSAVWMQQETAFADP